MTDEPVKKKKLNYAVLDQFQPIEKPLKNPYRLPSHPPGVKPIPVDSLALDGYGGGGGYGDYGTWASGQIHGEWAEGIGFQGYPAYAEMAQRSEFLQPCQIIAEEMTRKWIVISAKGDQDKTDRVNELTEAMTEFGLRETFRDATELEGIMGISFIYPDLMSGGMSVWEDNDEVSTKLTIDKSKIAKGSLKGFQVLDPTWMAPTSYDSRNPMAPTFFRPQEWFVMGKRVHASRMLKLMMRPVPDILKPAYNFGGLSLIQMMKPYVDNWLRTRQAVSDLVNAFTVWNLQTDMQAILQGGGAESMDLRLQLFSLMKNNRGILATDKSEETLDNISTPLGSLDALQAQAQEQMAAVARIPLVKLFGITPSGLNPSSEGEIRTFYDTVHGQQERLYGHILKQALDIIQLHLWGEIDDDLTFSFAPLWQLDEAGTAAVRKIDADTAAVYIASFVIDPEEERTRLAGDPLSMYAGLEGPAPEPIDLDNIPGSDDDESDKIGKGGISGANTGANNGV